LNCFEFPDQVDKDLYGVGDACDIDNLQSTSQKLNDQEIQLSRQNEILQSQISNLEDAYDGIDHKILNLESDVAGRKPGKPEIQQEIDERVGMVQNHSRVYMTGLGRSIIQKRPTRDFRNFRGMIRKVALIKQGRYGCA